MRQVSLFFTAMAVAATLSAAPDQEAPKKTTDMSSSDMAAVLFAANQGEIDQGMAAYPKLIHAAAKNFAKLMMDEHKRGLTNTTNIMATNKIVAHDEATDAVAIREKSKQIVKNFETAQGNVDRNFMVAQIEEHQQLLDLLDNKLIPSSRGDVLTLVQTTRFMVQQHLDRAKQILSELPQVPQP